ncbi:MAG TPA: NAD-dependent epimerase/dehydratase family protein [Thermoanaerobaculia bacterium]|nr:NAD-dependent epimerase/dehydratase family protein [Thermoanaerobaculia bacterium]
MAEKSWLSPSPPLRGRCVVLLGGLGFIGLNLVPELLRVGARVEIVNRSLDPLALHWLDRQAGGLGVGVHQGDLRNVDGFQDRLGTADLIINLAGESGAVKSERDALVDAQVNVGGHLAVLEALRVRRHSPRVVFISSRLVYGVTGRTPAGETHPARPTSLYGLHKLTVEHYHRIYWEHYGIPYTVLRLTNPYGAFQLPHRRDYGVINRFILSALHGETITLFGDGRQLRDYIHVSDVAAAILCALVDERASGETFNVGAGVSVSMREMAERIVQATGSGRVATVPWPGSYERVEPGDFLCDIERIKRRLGWKPRMDLELGLRRTVEVCRELLTDDRSQSATGLSS